MLFLRWKVGWIFISQKFLISTCVYIWFFYENRWCKSLRKVLLYDIFRTLSNSRFSKASYADTFRKLENSRNSTHFYKSVGKKFRTTTTDEVFLPNVQAVKLQKLFPALQRSNQCFQPFQSRKYSNNTFMSNVLRPAWQKNSATHVWW